MINDLWYKNAIVYCLSVGTYMDANADGIIVFMGELFFDILSFFGDFKNQFHFMMYIR